MQKKYIVRLSDEGRGTLEEVAKRLKGMTNRKIECRVIPPESDAEFSADMDERPVQLAKETRTPIAPPLHYGKAAGAADCVLRLRRSMTIG